MIMMTVRMMVLVTVMAVMPLDYIEVLSVRFRGFWNEIKLLFKKVIEAKKQNP